MRIGIDACCWANRRGYGRFTKELLNALLDLDNQNEYWLFADHQTVQFEDFPRKGHIVPVETIVPPVEAASASGRRSLRDLWAMTRAVMKQDLDLFFFPASYSYFPILNRTRIIVTIHDTLAETYPENVFPSKKLEFFWKAKHWFAIRQADLVITVSNHSKDQIMNYYHLRESKIRVIQEGPSRIFYTSPGKEEMDRILRNCGLKSQDRFLLYVGGISPHKNLRKLIDVFHRLAQEPASSDLKLVLVGDYHGDAFYSDYPVLKKMVQDMALETRVYFTGFVKDEDLVSLFKSALLLVLPSLQEGFGLPAVEAMACGTPVVVSNGGSLREVVGEAGLFFNPEDEDDMLRTLQKAISDANLLQEMSRRGKERAKEFDWGKASKVILSVFRQFERERP